MCTYNNKLIVATANELQQQQFAVAIHLGLGGTDLSLGLGLGDLGLGLLDGLGLLVPGLGIGWWVVRDWA